MYWKDDGYLLSKNNFDENSLIIEAFTNNHGKYTGVVYGGQSRKIKKILQLGNKILLNWKSKNENSTGYFNVEILKPVSANFFNDKVKLTCLLSASSILKILLPERQINKKIYLSFENLINNLVFEDFLKTYIFWEISLIKELGYEILSYNISTHNISSKQEIYKALLFNKDLFMENFIIPNKLKFPLHRNILEKYLK